MIWNTKAFAVSVQQEILVVTPQGDSLSFRDVDIQRECAEIKDHIERTRVQRVVVDLGRSAYFSSLMIGLINSIGQAAKENGGQMVLCNASQEMQTVLTVMKLDTLWPMFPTLPQALKVMKAWKPADPEQ